MGRWQNIDRNLRVKRDFKIFPNHIVMFSDAIHIKNMFLGFMPPPRFVLWKERNKLVCFGEKHSHYIISPSKLTST